MRAKELTGIVKIYIRLQGPTGGRSTNGSWPVMLNEREERHAVLPWPLGLDGGGCLFFSWHSPVHAALVVVECPDPVLVCSVVGVSVGP